MNMEYQKPTGAFVGASWTALLAGICAYLIGLWNATMGLNEKGYYLVILMYGLFSVVSLQKTVRDKIEGIPVTGIYYGLCWISVISAMLLLAVGLWNAALTLSEKGFYAMSFILSLFAAITVQKNIRDMGRISDKMNMPNNDKSNSDSTKDPKKEKPLQDEIVPEK
ncbi:conserved membrane hypothetical protein [Desulfamplus magnetovallimortis]|uniref:YiaAB two helix domain-containing protein n=1 Tax=Desulfamplus magnetovallimortis TaxID=1246637 RepID=A0A1W1H9F8_9BACT|nr:inner membrane protein YiaA [Desulfamplus magnetovallimortis]SLM29092.1 conserved membrane hypothetical protein [Desulfamplus magnetovallimortis]